MAARKPGGAAEQRPPRRGDPLPRGGEGKGSPCSMSDYAPACCIAIMSQICGSLSLHPSSQPSHRLCLPPVPAGCQKAVVSGNQVSWSCRAAWYRQPECQVGHADDDGGCFSDGQVPGAGRVDPELKASRLGRGPSRPAAPDRRPSAAQNAPFGTVQNAPFGTVWTNADPAGSGRITKDSCALAPTGASYRVSLSYGPTSRGTPI